MGIYKDMYMYDLSHTGKTKAYKATFNIEVRASDEESAFYEALDFLESNSPDDWLKIEKIDTDIEGSTLMKTDELLSTPYEVENEEEVCLVYEIL